MGEAGLVIKCANTDQERGGGERGSTDGLFRRPSHVGSVASLFVYYTSTTSVLHEVKGGTSKLIGCWQDHRVEGKVRKGTGTKKFFFHFGGNGKTQFAIGEARLGGDRHRFSYFLAHIWAAASLYYYTLQR